MKNTGNRFIDGVCRSALIREDTGNSLYRIKKYTAMIQLIGNLGND